MIKVDKIAAPKNNRKGRKPIYPWEQLKIGESFLMPGKFYSPYSSLAKYNERSEKPPIYITTRKEDGGVRVYRIKKPMPVNGVPPISMKERLKKK